MTEDFLEAGLRNDRYLKACRLVDQFENRLDGMLVDVGQRMVDEQPDLFPTRPDPRMKGDRIRSGGCIGFRRANFGLNDPDHPDENGDSRNLNVHLYWVDPAEYDRTDFEGTLRGFGYKIKGADRDVDERVARQTRDGGWELETAGNPFDSNLVFYRHVETASDLEETTETLLAHFAEFGDAWKY